MGVFTGGGSAGGGGGGGTSPDGLPYAAVFEVPNIAGRDDLLTTPGLTHPTIVRVLDASDDPTVDGGPATYVWNGYVWEKLSEDEAFTENLAAIIGPLAAQAHSHTEPLADIDAASALRKAGTQGQFMMRGAAAAEWTGNVLSTAQGIVVKAANYDGLTIHAPAQPGACLFGQPNDGTRLELLGFYKEANGEYHSYWGGTAWGGKSVDAHRFYTAGALRCYVDKDGHVRPGADLAYDLGSTARRWRQAHAGLVQVGDAGADAMRLTPTGLETSADGGATWAPVANAALAALAHDHANKDTLDQLDHDDARLPLPAYIAGGRDIVQIIDSTATITVAPDAGSIQAGDWPTPGEDGIRGAMRELARLLPNGPYVRTRVLLRAGTYNLTSPLQMATGAQHRMTIAGLDAPNTAINDLNAGMDRTSFNNTVRGKFPARLLCAAGQWTAIFVDAGQHLEVSNILVESPGHIGGAIRAYRRGSLRVSNVASIGFGTCLRALEGGVIRHTGLLLHGCVDGFVSATLSAGTNGIISAAASGADMVSHRAAGGVYVANSGHVYVDGDTALKQFHVWNQANDAIAGFHGGDAAVYGVDAIGGARFIQSGSGATVRMIGARVEGNTGALVYTYGSANTHATDIEKIAGSGWQKTVYTATAASAYVRGNALNYSPALGTVGNNGGVNY